MSEPELTHLHYADDDNEAAALLDELERSGIEASVVHDPERGPTVRVSASDHERAKRVLRAWLGEEAGAPSAPRPAKRASTVGLVAGVALAVSVALNVWLALRLHTAAVFVEGDTVSQYDRAGRLRGRFEYAAGAERPFRVTTYGANGEIIAVGFDRNEDGNIEKEVSYQDGAPTGESVDADEDGRFERATWESSSGGTIRYEDMDRDGLYDRMEVRHRGRTLSRATDGDADFLYERITRLSGDEPIARLEDRDGDGFYERASVREPDGSWRTIEILSDPP